MTRQYTLRNGKVILMEVCERFLESGKKIFYHYPTEKDLYTPDNFVIVSLGDVTNTPYFKLDGEAKYFGNYDYLPLDQFIKKIHQGALTKGEITRDQFVATLLKESEKIGFVFPAYEHGPVTRTFCPMETEESSRTNWENKITLVAGGIVGELYTSDLFRYLCEGSVKLVNRNQDLENNPLKDILKKVFGKKVKKPR